MRRDKLYGRRWRKARRVFLDQHPLCKMCQDHGIVRQATEVDHIVPHKGDPLLFWNVGNWQGLCYTHHRSTKARIERNGHDFGCDKDGIPLDGRHHWNEG
jgi:5-methylcytosine-specific restriction endonuclease McrA